MKKDAFEAWLKSKQISSTATFISRLHAVEAAYGDLDAQYDKDRCTSLLELFRYSKNAQKNKQRP